MTFPEPHRLFLATICNYFHDKGRWPTYGDLDRALMYRDDFDVEDVGRELESFMYDAPYSPIRDGIRSARRSLIYPRFIVA